MNETIQTMLSRRSVRAYTDQPMERELLETVLNCGIHAPSGKNQQEIKLTAITNGQIINEIRLIARDEFSKMEPTQGQYTNIAIQNARTKPDYNFTFGAPVLVVATGPAGWPNGMADSALALGNVILSATALGLGSCYVNQLRWLNGNEPMRDYLAKLGIGREEEIYGSAVLGHSAASPRPAAPRKEGRICIVD